MPLMSDEICYAGQTIALVVADTKEAADDAAERIEVAYRAEPAAASIHAAGAGAPVDAAESIKVGDAEGAFAAAEVKVETRYTTPAQHHNPIELYATTALWHGSKLTVYLPSQWVKGTQVGLAKALGVPPDDVQVISPYVGGGFGSKGSIMPHTVLVAAAARRLGRPVKLVVSREDMYPAGSFRPATTQHVALAAARDGSIQALIHEQSGQTSRMDQACFPGTKMTSRMYAVPNIRTRETVIATDVNTPGFMRAPFETPTFFGLESAMDELAVALGHGPGRAAHQERARQGPDQGPAVEQPLPRAMLPARRRALRLVAPHARSGLDARGRRSDRLGVRQLCAREFPRLLAFEPSPTYSRVSGPLARLAAPRTEPVFGVARMQPQPVAGEMLAEHAALQQRRLGRPLGRTNCLAASGIAGQAQDHHEHRIHRIAQSSKLAAAGLFEP
jgi:xanthine dehydrogenase YagR molybdenum-binding subunit